jgi:hypothetical protein
MPLRPRTSRTTNGEWAQSYLTSWEHLVKRAEAGVASHLTGCPQCDGDDGREARDQLEALIVRGGRRGERLRRLVAPMDDRFMRATTPDPLAAHAGGWWWRRYLD